MAVKTESERVYHTASLVPHTCRTYARRPGTAPGKWPLKGTERDRQTDRWSCEVTHQVAVCIGRLQRVASKLGHKLRHGMFVSLADMIQQSQGVILHATNKTQSQRHRRWWRSIVVKTYIHTYIKNICIAHIILSKSLYALRSLNNKVFSCRMKVANDRPGCHRPAGRSFQTGGPAAEKLLSPNLL